jgi:hypothetical protein
MDVKVIPTIIEALIFVVFLYLMLRNKADYDFFQEETASGKKSNSLMRAGFILIILYTLYYIQYQISHGNVVDPVLVTTLLGTAIGGKVAQKFTETKNNDDSTKNP